MDRYLATVNYAVTTSSFYVEGMEQLSLVTGITADMGVLQPRLANIQIRFRTALPYSSSNRNAARDGGGEKTGLEV
jgi:hypothetical protein